MHARLIILTLLLTLALLAPASASAARPAPEPTAPTRIFYPMWMSAPLWTPAASLHQARFDHAAVLLPSGEVFVTGGLAQNALQEPVFLASAERTDPEAVEFWSRCADMPAPRTRHAAVVLPSGKVLVAGGYTGYELNPAAELYDPVADRWSSAGSLSTPLCNPSLTVLQSGRVLIAGETCTGAWSAELYDPLTNAWTPATQGLDAAPVGPAVLLPSGQVLVAGNMSRVSLIYDPAAARWIRAADTLYRRGDPVAVLVPSGQVLLVGGITFDGGYRILASAELYDPIANLWTPAAPAHVARWGARAVLLDSGQVLLAGGNSLGGLTASAELYDPQRGTWAWAPSLNWPRTEYTLTRLHSGAVLAVGGLSPETPAALDSADLYTPARAE